MKKKIKKRIKIMFAVVLEDKAGQTIQLFKTAKQAEEFLKAGKG